MILNIELSDDEVLLLKQKAGSMPLKEYARSVLLKDSDVGKFIINTLSKSAYIEKKKLYYLYRQHCMEHNKASMSYRHFNYQVSLLAYTVRPGIEGRPFCWKLKTYS